MNNRLLSPVIGLVLLFGLASSADAQGNGRPKAPKSTTPAPAPAPVSGDTTSSTATIAPAVGFRQFGSWLDDASAMVRGDGYTTIGVGHWRLDGATQTNMPMIGVGLGVTDRVQVSASVPFYRVQYPDGSVSGIDDLYFSAKYTVVDPTLTVGEFGIAVSPVLEVLSAGAPDGRVHFAVPVSLEVRRDAVRVFGSAGYFSRGSVFTGAALEWTTPVNLVLTGSLTQSYSLPEDATLDSLGIGRNRMDATGSLGVPLGSRAVAYAAAGRTISRMSDGGTSLALSGGISLRFSAPTHTP